LLLPCERPTPGRGRPHSRIQRLRRSPCRRDGPSECARCTRPSLVGNARARTQRPCNRRTVTAAAYRCESGSERARGAVDHL